MIQINIPMPSSCRDCLFRERDYGYCILFSYGVLDRNRIERFTERPPWCELEGDKDVRPDKS